MESSGELTSRMTVFMVPPCYVFLKINHQLFRRYKLVVAFNRAEMSMVTFANLVVVTNDAYRVNHVGKSVLEVMVRACNRLWDLPKNQLGKSARRVNDASSRNQYCLHVGDYDNRAGCCQLIQHGCVATLAVSRLFPVYPCSDNLKYYYFYSCLRPFFFASGIFGMQHWLKYRFFRF